MKKTVVISIVSLFLLLNGKNGINARSLLPPANGQSVISNNVESLEQQGRQLYESGDFQGSITILEQLNQNYATQGNLLAQIRVLRNLALNYQELGNWSASEQSIAQIWQLVKENNLDIKNELILAQIFEVQGKQELVTGKVEQAMDSWQQAILIYQTLNDVTGVTKNQLNQTQALRQLGLYRQAISKLDEINQFLAQKPDDFLKAKALQNLGDTLRVIGELERSQVSLEQSLAISQKIADSNLEAGILLSLANNARSQQQTQPALDLYQQAITTATSLEIKTQAEVNQISLLAETNKWSEINSIIDSIQGHLAQLPLNTQSINTRINLAENLMLGLPQQPNQSIITELLVTAIKQAQALNNNRLSAYSLGSLGHLYEINQQWQQAEQLTKQALNLAQSNHAPDISYRLSWQLGRILEQQGDRPSAIAAYTDAVTHLEAIRSDLIAISSDVQFSFRKTVEPVYRELVSLLLTPGEEAPQENLIEARKLIEALQLAELDNFFRDSCLDAQPVQIDQIDQQAAVIYPIILKDRLEVIAAIPGKPLYRYTTILPEATINKNILDLRYRITRYYRLAPLVKAHLPLAQTLYNWLIKPLEADLKAQGIKTLVFVPDGPLRNLPMSVLYDGKQYLIEKYGVAIAPGLQLINSKPLKPEKIGVTLAGLSEASQGFSALPGVETELNNISELITHQIIINQSFTKANLEKTITSNPYPIVHLATHGQFSSQADKTFILVWNGRLNALELSNLIKNKSNQDKPIELLILSACQTALGDERAALGLAGLAARAGARSTIASLWSVNDLATTSLMSQLYQQLTTQQVSKADALRQAQISLIKQDKFSHPYYWSAFILVGNWL